MPNWLRKFLGRDRPERVDPEEDRRHEGETASTLALLRAQTSALRETTDQMEATLSRLEGSIK